MKREISKSVALTTTAVMSALVCVMTVIVTIPSPTKGYFNLGDCFVLLSGWLLGSLYGFFAASVGSALADLFLGYVIYIPATFLLKGMMAVVISVVPALLFGRDKHPRISWVTASVLAELVMIVGYYLYEAVIIGFGFVPALAGIAGNAIQGVAGSLSAYFIAEIISHTSIVKVYKAYELTKQGETK